ncbi:zinc finger protein 93-like [Galleria mellonella]|uniref:Zinc finger protein 93-like n=1 Tax=Galleria mellonella TaxID=7137 RepID=A0A6J1WKL2_GALME|nr:zinc finger protein 93-like [Galleria mellonella]
MAVYLTKNMLLKLNRVTYSSNYVNDDEGSSNSDHWQNLIKDNKSTDRLAKDMICRVCAKSGCTPLTEKINGYDITSAIRSITNVNIELDDSLPKYICTECLERLKMAMTFKRTCETSDKKFRKILNPMGDPSMHSYPYSKHDFQLILHQMKQKRMKYEEKLEKERKKREKLEQKKLPKIKQFKCSPCDMIFPNKDKLMAHRRERQCMRRACDVCGQLVLSIAQHMRHIHKQTVPHKCPTCGKEFPIIARLKNHMLVHTDTFNFFCDLCPYKCKHKYYLVMHMRTHTGEKPYKCQQCPATFVNPSNLNKHKLTHREKQFKCMLCEKAFRTNTALREHQEATHMHIKHTCNFCGRDFCYKSDLRKHEIRNHNRMKRDYIGGEPTYKQVERMQKLQENEALSKWRIQTAEETTVPVVQATYIDQSKEFIQTTHSMYFSDVTGMIQQQPQIVQQQTVQLSLPELVMKKDEVKIYDTQQGIYF